MYPRKIDYTGTKPRKKPGSKPILKGKLIAQGINPSPMSNLIASWEQSNVSSQKINAEGPNQSLTSCIPGSYEGNSLSSPFDMILSMLLRIALVAFIFVL